MICILIGTNQLNIFCVPSAINGDDMKIKMNAERHAKTYFDVQKVIMIKGQRVIPKKNSSYSYLRKYIFDDQPKNSDS